MKPLDRQSEAIFRKLTNGLAQVGDCRRIDGSIVVEVIGRTKLGPLVSIAHFDENPNGDQVRDMGVVFLISNIKAITGDLVQDTDEYIYPISCRQGSWDQESVVINNGRWNVRQKLQTNICRFADQWMLELSEQQDL